jgi:DNA-damage-inducible protein D
MKMDESNDTALVPPNLSFESLKKLNEHGVEYWSGRDLQPCLGYSQWRRFENAITKAMESCHQSGNDPQNHFAGAGKMVDMCDRHDTTLGDERSL